MLTSTSPDIPAIESRAAAATKGPWEIDRYPHGGARIYTTEPRELIADVYNEGDRELIFEAPTTILALVARVRELEGEVGAKDARIVMQDLRIASLLQLVSKVTGGYPQTYVLGVTNPAEDENPDLKPYTDAVKAALADLRDRYL